MESAYHTPLLDQFRQGSVARDVRLLAAQGKLAPRAHEQLALLAILVTDEDVEIAAAAEATVNGIPRPALERFLARGDVSSDLRKFFAGRGIEPGTAGPAGDADAPLVERGAEETSSPEDEDEGTALQRLAALTVPERVARAMKGSREERGILIRDSNKLVAAAVLSSPKLTETEVESIAKMANVSEDILRIIARTRTWVKNYSVIVALAKNPKTPVALSMNFLSRLNERDLRMLTADRNVPDVLRLTAKKKLVSEK
jgi:hypothetical protein